MYLDYSSQSSHRTTGEQGYPELTAGFFANKQKNTKTKITTPPRLSELPAPTPRALGGSFEDERPTTGLPSSEGQTHKGRDSRQLFLEKRGLLIFFKLQIVVTKSFFFF